MHPTSCYDRRDSSVLSHGPDSVALHPPRAFARTTFRRAIPPVFLILNL